MVYTKFSDLIACFGFFSLGYLESQCFCVSMLKTCAALYICLKHWCDKLTFLCVLSVYQLLV